MEIKKFFKQSQYPEFYPKIWEMGGVDWESFQEYPNDYYAANTGVVPGCIYYVDTVAFAKKHHLQILQMLDEFEQDCGRIEDKPSPVDEDEYFNWLTWFAWESLAGDLINWVEEMNEEE